jgi:enoyl-CoA hydratase
MVQMLEENTVLVTEGPISQVMINRPQNMNALNLDVLQGLTLAFERLERNSTLRVITLWGAGTQAFAAGMDVHAIVDLGKRPIAEYVELGQRALRAIERCRVPVIAALNGYAFGAGLELALACDLMVAAAEAKLGLPDAGLGLIPALGGIERLSRRCSIGAVRRLVYTAELIDAPQAQALGLVDKVAAPGTLTEEVHRLAEAITAQAPLAVAQAKQLILSTHESATLAGLRREVEAFLGLFGSADREEGMRAFMQKRTPDFKAR